MAYPVNGLTDIHTILENDRKIGGVIEAQKIRLRSGEEYTTPAIMHIDFSGAIFYTITFMTDNGERKIVHVNDISMIDLPVHKKIHELQNKHYKEIKLNEKINYLKRLCEVNEGSHNPLFLQEVKNLVEDLGINNVPEEMDISFISDKKVYKIA